MKLEGLITCVDYSDFLAVTLPLNRQFFNQLVVVTAPEDELTARICEYWHVRCLETDAFDSRWGKFNKGAAINEGLGALDRDGWVLHLDADIMCPPLFRRILDRKVLDPACIYGCDRHSVPDAQSFAGHMFDPQLQQEDDVYIHLDSFPLSPRISIASENGWVPIGFFQLWNPTGSGVHNYPEHHKASGARTDTMFAGQWPPEKRVLLPDLLVYHLASGPTEMGANWDGRTTPVFGDAWHPHRHRFHHHRRRHHRTPHPYGWCEPDER